GKKPSARQRRVCSTLVQGSLRQLKLTLDHRSVGVAVWHGVWHRSVNELVRLTAVKGTARAASRASRETSAHPSQSGRVLQQVARGPRSCVRACIRSGSSTVKENGQ